MYSVAMLSATEGWAVGSPNGYTGGQGNNGIILHYLNGSWTQVASPATPNPLESVAKVSVQEGWAVGGGGTILHYVNKQWVSQASPTTSGLSSIAMVTSSEGWAVGDNTILHYSAGRWTQVYTGSATLASVT